MKGAFANIICASAVGIATPAVNKFFSIQAIYSCLFLKKV